jgi:hypothetical protein
MAISTIDTTQIIFFQNQTSDITTDPFVFLFPKGNACINIWGVWDGAAVEIMTAPSLDPTYFIGVGTGGNSTPLSFTQDVTTTIENIPYGSYIVAVLSGSGGSTSLSATASVI